MKLSRRQFMKKVFTTGAAIPRVHAIPTKVAWVDEPAYGRGKKFDLTPKWDDCDIFDPAGCCIWGTERIKGCNFDKITEVLYRSVEARIPPDYRNKVVVYFCLHDYAMQVKFVIMYITKHNKEVCTFKIDCLLKLGWHYVVSGSL